MLDKLTAKYYNANVGAYPSPESEKRFFRQSPFLYCCFVFEMFIVQYLYLIPWTVLVGLVGQVRTRVYRSPILFEPPYSPNIKPGVNLPVAAGCVAILLPFLLLIPHRYCLRYRRGWWLVVAAIKFGITACFAVSVYLQSTFLPRPLGSCDNSGTWPDPSSVPEGTPTMFEVMPEITCPRRKCSTHCGDIIERWRMMIALAILMGISACCAVVVFVKFEQFFDGKPPERADYVSRYCAAPFRYASAIIRRRRRHNDASRGPEEEQSNVGLLEGGTHIPYSEEMKEGVPGAAGRHARQQCSCPEDVSPEKAPPAKLEAEASWAKGNSAKQAYKAACWGCGAQVCDNCKRTKPIQPPLQPELTCDQCFYNKACKTMRNWSWFSPVTCSGHQDTDGSKEPVRKPIHVIELCSSCQNLEVDTLSNLRLRRERCGDAELRLLSHCCEKTRPGRKSEGGSKAGGRLWWCCQACGGQCTGGSMITDDGTA